MEKFAFLSRHEPTQRQHELVANRGITLVHIGDADAFTVGPAFIDHAGAFDGVVVVHPAAALRLAGAFVIGVFENASRPPVDGRPQFDAAALHLYDLRG